jgi:hypothetical protein
VIERILTVVHTGAPTDDRDQERLVQLERQLAELVVEHGQIECRLNKICHEIQELRYQRQCRGAGSFRRPTSDS